ncbi:MAG TPA: hypothetical protein VFI78_01310 [Salinimicrobium sp.]|nr:hypothetical protein [Salinimicrobium sp.]
MKTHFSKTTIQIMLQKLLRFTLGFLLSTVILYGLHLLLVSWLLPEKDLSLIHFSYIFNVGITYVFIIGLFLASRKLKDQLGFIFLTGGIVKIGAFLFLINLLDFELTKSNFFDFFIAYFSCLAFEIFYVSRLLKNLNTNNNG